MAIDQTASGISSLKMVIGGKTVDAADGQTFEIVNPATGAAMLFCSSFQSACASAALAAATSPSAALRSSSRPRGCSAVLSCASAPFRSAASRACALCAWSRTACAMNPPLNSFSCCASCEEDSASAAFACTTAARSDSISATSPKPLSNRLTPRAASAFATASPMPLVEPVTTTDLPFNMLCRRPRVLRWRAV